MDIFPFKKSNQLKHRAIIHQGTADKNSGMYIGEANNPDCKENRNILVTHKVYDFDDYFTVTTNEQYKRKVAMRNSDGTITGYHLPGEYKQRKILRKYPIEGITNLSVCWALAADYPTVSYGMTSWRRDAFILDSDQKYNSIIEAKNKLDYFTTAFKLPKVNYILRNPKSKHIQAGWFLDKPFSKKEFSLFNVYIKQIAIAYKDFTKCDGDICFNGPACKNPYYNGFEQLFVNSEICSREQFKYVYNYTPVANKLFTYNSSPSSLSYNNTVVTADKSKSAKQLIKSTSKSGGRHYFGDKTSRDYLECKWLREWIWSCMRNDDIPTERQARAKLDEFAKIAAEQTGKPVHSASELNSKCSCTYKWSVSHFKTTEENGKQKEGAAFGNFVQKLQSYITMYVIDSYKQKGMSCREIAAVTGYSAMTVSRADLSKVDVEAVQRFIDYYKSVADVDGFQVFKQQYQELYSCLCKLLFTYNSSSSSLSYNNTVVTVDNNITDNSNTKQQQQQQEQQKQQQDKLEIELQNMKTRTIEQSARVQELQEFLNQSYTWEEYQEATWRIFGCRAVMQEYANAYRHRDISYFQRTYRIA